MKAILCAIILMASFSVASAQTCDLGYFLCADDFLCYFFMNFAEDCPAGEFVFSDECNVQLVLQTSGSFFPCTENETFGCEDSVSFYVTQGCAGVFSLQGKGIECESANLGKQVCALTQPPTLRPTHIPTTNPTTSPTDSPTSDSVCDLKVIQQLSDSPCVRDSSYGCETEYSFYVTQGCRAIFSVNNIEVECRSSNFAKNVCMATFEPTSMPTSLPTSIPTSLPSDAPSILTSSPSSTPTCGPTRDPTVTRPCYDLNLCENGATCTDNGLCECLPNYTGSFCEYLYRMELFHSGFSGSPIGNEFTEIDTPTMDDCALLALNYDRDYFAYGTIDGQFTINGVSDGSKENHCVFMDSTAPGETNPLWNVYYVYTEFPPTRDPTETPTKKPSVSPTPQPTNAPSTSPTPQPTSKPSTSPTLQPTNEPTFNPTKEPTIPPTLLPTSAPTKSPSFNPTAEGDCDLTLSNGEIVECLRAWTILMKGKINNLQNEYEKLKEEKSVCSNTEDMVSDNISQECRGTTLSRR